MYELDEDGRVREVRRYRKISEEQNK